MNNFRSRKLLDHARDRQCQLQIRGVCNGNHHTVVAAHSNQQLHGRGVGHKAHDWACTWACYACHAWLDTGPATRDEKREAFYIGLSRTLSILFDERLVVVA